MPSLIRALHASSKLSSSFIYRSVDAWNYFPSNIKLLNSLNSLNSFKSVIKLFDLYAFSKCSFLMNYVIRYLAIVLFIQIYGLLLAVVNDHSCNPPIACI